MKELEYIDYCTCTTSVAKYDVKKSEYTCFTCHRPLGAYVPPLLPEEADTPRLPSEAYNAVLMDSQWCDDCLTHYFNYHDCRSFYEH